MTLWGGKGLEKLVYGLLIPGTLMDMDDGHQLAIYHLAASVAWVLLHSLCSCQLLRTSPLMLLHRLAFSPFTTQVQACWTVIPAVLHSPCNTVL
jgi:hypothetical protein